MSSDAMYSCLGTMVSEGQAELQTGPFGTMLKAEEYSSEGAPVISAGEIREGYLEIGSKTPRVSNETIARLPRFLLKQNDIVFGRKGSTHRNALIRKGEEGCFLGSDGIRLRVNSKSICPKYLSYQLRSARAVSWLKANSEGTTMPSLNQDILSRFPITLLPVAEQRAVAHILGTLDDKIELNRKTNETLEAMAKALFKSWFVDFDPVRAKAEGRPTGLPAEISDLCPDSLWDSELGEIPSGWEVGGLEEFLVLQRGFDLPAPQRIKGAYPVVAASGVSGTHNEAMAFAPGVVTGRSGVLGKVFYIQTDFFPLNTTLWAKEFRLATPIYGYFLLSDIDFAVFNAGSAVPTLNRNHLGSLRFPLPSKALVVSFTEVAANLMKRKEGIAAEISNLSTARDALLPKLISGEIRIPDAEKMLEEVGV
jgi:type I restriction enzyme S subunit